MSRDDSRDLDTGNSRPIELKFINIQHPRAALEAGNRHAVRSHVMVGFKRQQKQRSTDVIIPNPLRRIEPQHTNSRLAGESDTVEHLKSNPSCDCKLSSLYQPSRVVIFQNHFMSHFISYISKRNVSTVTSFFSWSMPTFLHDTTLPSLKHVIYAITTNFYGTMTGDKSIQMQSRLPYGIALQGLHCRLSKGRATEMEALTSVLLSIYEARNGETKNGWIQHVMGAEKLLLASGLESRRGKLADGIIRCIKYGIVQSICVRRTPTKLAVKPWLSVPFPKTSFDKLVDLCLSIPSLLYELDNLRTETFTTFTLQSMFNKAMKTKGSLEEWFYAYLKEEMRNEDGPPYQDVKSVSAKQSVDHDSSNDVYQPPIRTFRDSQVSEAISVVSAGLLYVLSVLRDVCLPEPQTVLSYNSQIVLFSDFILSTVPHTDKVWGRRSGPTSLIFPLKTVVMFTPDMRQREYAIDKLYRWDRGIGCGGSLEVPVVVSGNLHETKGFHIPT